MFAGNSAPRWQRLIEEALEDDSNANVYQLATLDLAAPHVRSLVHRAFLAPRTPAHPLLLTTTDARSPKARQLAQHARIELAWWLPRAEAQVRVAGNAHVLPAPDFALRASDASGLTEQEQEEIEMAVNTLRNAFSAAKLGGAGFDWETLRCAQFDAMSGHLRASWVQPVPGTRLHGADAEPETLPKLGDAADESTKEGRATKALVEAALRNFALVLIDPVEVDYVELGVVPNRRTRFFKDEEGSWREEALVP